MLKTRLKIFAVLLLGCMLNMRAETFVENGIYYEVINNTLNVSVAPPPQGEVYSGAIQIPSSVDHDGRPYSVKAIGTGAFAGSGEKLTSISMDNTIEKIEDNAFFGCTAITSVEIPNRAIYLGASAFEGCSNLGTVTLSAYLETIKARAFADCVKLSRMEVKDKITSIADQAFLNCVELTSLSLPSTLKSIGISAFEGCTKLYDITLPKELTKLGDAAFMNCKALNTVVIPDGITEIKQNTFAGCEVLSNVTFSPSLSVIAAGAFSKTALVNLTIPQTVTEIGDAAFNGITPLRTLKFESAVSPIKYGVDVFTSSPIESLELGRTLNCTVANSGPFKDQVNLKNIKITGTCQTLPENIFSGCTALVDVTVESGLVEIKSAAFKGCKSMAKLLLPETVQAIRPNAFNGCFILKEFKMPPMIQKVEMQAFYECRALPEIDLSNIVEIQNGAFYGCDGLRTVSFSDNLVTIGNDVFSDCLNLEEVTIPGNVKTVGDGVFFGCPKLITVTFGAGAETMRMGEKIFVDSPIRNFTLGRNVEYTGDLDLSVFGDNKTLYEVTILPSVTKIADCMFANCGRLSKVNIPANVDAIGANAFKGCNDLTEVTSQNEVAPKAVASSFGDVTYNNATLNVPEDGENSYKQADGWKLFYCCPIKNL